MKSGDPPTETDQATWKTRTSKETAAAQQPKDQDVHHPRHFFDRDYTVFDVTFAHTLKETTKASRWIAYTTIHPPDQARQFLDTSSRAQAKTAKPLQHPISRFTTPWGRNAKPPYTVYFDHLLQQRPKRKGKNSKTSLFHYYHQIT
jgi:hypothetical protein